METMKIMLKVYSAVRATFKQAANIPTVIISFKIMIQ